MFKSFWFRHAAEVEPLQVGFSCGYGVSPPAGGPCKNPQARRFWVMCMESILQPSLFHAVGFNFEGS